SLTRACSILDRKSSGGGVPSGMVLRGTVTRSLALLTLALASCRGGGSRSLASGKSIAALSFLKANNAIPVDSTATITGSSAVAFLPPGSDATSLKATFTASDKATVTVGGRPQTSGSTANDFSQAVGFLV